MVQPNGKGLGTANWRWGRRRVVITCAKKKKKKGQGKH